MAYTISQNKTLTLISAYSFKERTYLLSSFMKKASIIRSPIGLMANSGMRIKSSRLLIKKKTIYCINLDVPLFQDLND